MQNILFFLLLVVFSLEGKETICLNMIVKDESHVIRRCLESVKPLIDYWVIVDTGSSDSTKEIIQKCLADIPGELHERSWVHFGHNRNEALALAQGKGDYLLFMDADDYLVFSPHFTLPSLIHDEYSIFINHRGLCYSRTHLVRAALDWKWHGSVHEYIHSPQVRTRAKLEGITNYVMTEGARSRDPEKYHKDAAMLEQSFKEDPTNGRTVFYLAQSYRDAGDTDKAIVWYTKRAAMGGWSQEIYWSLLQIGMLQEKKGAPLEQIIASYQKAHSFRPQRAEALYRLANLYRRKEMYQEGYDAARQGWNIPLPDDILFVEKWMYDYGLLFEWSICSYYIGRIEEAIICHQILLARESLPQSIQECLVENAEKITKRPPYYCPF